MPGPLDPPPLSPVRLSTQSATRSLFPGAPTFALDTFSDRDFLVKDFVESLSDAAVPANRRSGQSAQAFDPRPLIRSFEHALNRISEISGDLESREAEVSTAVRRAEAQHNSNVQTLGRKLEQAVDSFRKLDRQLNGDGYNESGANTAIKVGEKLEELDGQRLRAQDAKFLIQCWLEVSERGELFMLEDMRRQTSGAQKIRCAQIARQLLRISQRLDPENQGIVSSRINGLGINGVNGIRMNGDSPARPKHNTREIIERFSEVLEQDLLDQFDEFYRRANFDGMRDCATVLQDFKGGDSVMSRFINQHGFFIDRTQLVTDEVGGDAEMWELLADPDKELPGVEPSLQSLADEVKVVLLEESSIIKRSFPYYETVLGRFISRIFQQSIQQRLEKVLHKASTVSTLTFLRSLQAARSYIHTLAEELKSHGLTEHPDVLSSQTALVLDQQFEELFVPYFGDSSYIEREKRNLEELYSSLLFKFTVFHSRRRKAPSGYLASLASSGREMLSSARDATLDRLNSADLSPQQKAMLNRVAGLKDNDGTKRQAEIELSDEDGIVQIANTKRMLKWFAEAVGRSLELSGGTDTPKDVSTLLDILLLHMGQLYIETALDAANDAAAAQESTRNDPDLSYLENLHALVTTMHLMASCIDTVLIPLAASNPIIRREMQKTTNVAMSNLEEKVNNVMQRTIDVIIRWTGRLLDGQKKGDFKPREDADGGGAWLEALQTPTCALVFKFLSRVQHLLLLALSPSPSLTILLTDTALQLRPLLFTHFTKFQVSATGGIMVQKDVSKYNELLRNWELGPSFQPSLEMLSEIGNIFVIGPEALRERLRGKGVKERGELRAYVLRRDDAGSVGVQSVLNTL